MDHTFLFFQRYNVQCSHGMIMIFQIRPHQRRKLFLPWTGNGCMSIHTKSRTNRFSFSGGDHCCCHIQPSNYLKRCRSYHIADSHTYHSGTTGTSLYGSRTPTMQQQTPHTRPFTIKAKSSEDVAKTHLSRSLLFSFQNDKMKSAAVSNAKTTVKRTATTKAAMSEVSLNGHQGIEHQGIHENCNPTSSPLNGSAKAFFEDEAVSRFTPKEILNSYYMMTLPKVGRKKSISTRFANSNKIIMIQKPDEKGIVQEQPLLVWHSIFTCPFNNKQYPCGKRISLLDCVFETENNTGKVNGKGKQQQPYNYHYRYYYYYKTRREAEHAAAARRLDELQILNFPLCYKEDINHNHIDKNNNDNSKTTKLSKEGTPYKLSTFDDNNVKSDDDNYELKGNADQQAINKGTATSLVHDVDNKDELLSPEEYYLKEHNLIIMEDNYVSETISSSCFEFTDNNKEKKVPINAWTSTFTCPISGIQYPSGTLRSLVRSKDPLLLGYLLREGQKGSSGKVSVTPVLPQKLGKVKVYYRTKRAAQDAASKRALDIIRLQVYNTSAPRFCRENPSTKSEQHTCNDDEKSINDSNSKNGNRDKRNSIASSSNSNHLTPTIYGKMNDRAQKLNGNFHNNSINNIGDHNHKKNKSALISAISMPTVDTLFNQISQIDQNVRLGDTTLTSSTVSEQNLNSSIYNTAITPNTMMLDINANVDGPSDDLHGIKTMKLDQDIQNLLTGMVEDDENEMDTVVTFIQNTTGKAPAQRLLESAVTTVDQPLERFITDNNQQQSSLKSIIVKQTESVVVTAEAWLESFSDAAAKTKPIDTKNPHRLTLPRKQSDQKLIVAKTILSALAEASQATPIGVTSPIEPIAKKVLDNLWKSDKNCSPDADTYSYFLKCIDGTNPIVAVEKAEAIVEAMVKEAKHTTNADYTLPKPNQSTYNALIQITAQIGGTSGRYPKFTETNFVPDRLSFLSILSSCIYSPNIESEFGGFDREFVQECIHRMTELAEEQRNDLLLPDTYVYNAPLRWSGGPILWAQSRPYTRIIPWDDYEQIYAKGVKEEVDDDNIRVKQSRDMESWLEVMEKESVSNKRIAPNVETYEAVIQGWLRTGTREGLDRAQALLRRLIHVSNGNINLTPRIQTFHPILMSLYHSKIDDSWDKIYEWIGEWEQLISNSDDNNGLDARMIGMKLTALLQKQKAAFRDRHKKSEHTLQELHNQMISNAMLCSKLVHDASAHVERKAMRGAFDDTPLDISFFLHASTAWEFVATAGLEDKDPKMTYNALSEIISLLVRFENIIKATKPMLGLSFRVPTPLYAQLEHFVEHAHPFLSLIVAQLSLHHNIDDRPEVLLLIEKMTRAIGEFDEIEDFFNKADEIKNNKVDFSKRLVPTMQQVFLPDDHFTYQIKQEHSTNMSRYSFLWQVIKFLEQVSKDKDNINDIVRLCHLVKNIASARRRSTNLVETVDKILYHVHYNFTQTTKLDGQATNGKAKAVDRNRIIKKAPSRSIVRSPTRQRKTSKTRKKLNGSM
jgi:hypothetical protein